MEKRDSTTLSDSEKAEILSAYTATCRGDHEDAVFSVARRFKVDEATVRLIVFRHRGTQAMIV